MLDLGAGTGLLSLLLTAAVPGVRLTLVDGAPGMLAVAAGHLDARGVPHRTVHADLAGPLPAGRYDAVVSALAIHHLDDEGKRALYKRAADALVPGGVFVNAEQVAGPTPRWIAATTRCGRRGSPSWAPTPRRSPAPGSGCGTTGRPRWPSSVAG